MSLLKRLGLLTQGGFIREIDAIEELLLIMVVEFLDHPIAPRFPRRNKPKLDAMMETEADQAAHTAWMSRTAVEDHLVIDLEMVGDPQSLPDRPYCLDTVRTVPLRDRLDGTATTGQIHGMETVKARRTPQVTRTDEIHLMDAIDAGAFQSRIGFALGLIALVSRGDQSLTAQDAMDRTEGR